ncbi:uncharacterized protein LOC127085189 isoform X1 [Lathyrus oleraceus]|uniref:uncharacterized protein LOC127085189 isoform X1 n=1 Tax=Pisum sativum TaxID=3888 RepID=UPI0021D3E5E1|nr:uncharacterized protein LOC127085189 isoform X1 [Pisum sativum]
MMLDICLDGDALLSSSLIRVDDDAGYLKVSLYDNGTCPSKHISILSSKDKGSMFASYIGFLVRQHIPITCDNWRSPDLKVGKEKIWSEIQACVSIEDGYLPKVTFVVVQKRHHTRLFPVNPKETDRSGNIMPGFFNIFLNAAGIYYHLNLSRFADFVVLNCQRNRGRHQRLSP